jgi:hypothetical protein
MEAIRKNHLSSLTGSLTLNDMMIGSTNRRIGGGVVGHVTLSDSRLSQRIFQDLHEL